MCEKYLALQVIAMPVGLVMRLQLLHGGEALARRRVAR